MLVSCTLIQIYFFIAQSPSPKQESSRAPRQTEEGEELFRMQDEEKLKLLSLIKNLKESEAIKREDPL